MLLLFVGPTGVYLLDLILLQCSVFTVKSLSLLFLLVVS